MSSANAPVVIVTGASKGLGKAVALKLLARGARVIGVARSKESLEQVKEEAGPQGEFTCYVGNLTEAKVAKQVVSLALTKYQRLDGLVNNAGLLEPIRKVADTSVDDWKRHFDVNLFAVLELTREALPHLRETKGRIINLSSGAATRAYQAWGAYCASKAALNMFTQVVSSEEPDVVSVAIRPGVVKTEMQASIYEEGAKHMDPEEYKKFKDLRQNNALLPPEVPGAVIANLALDAKKELSGKFLSFDDEMLSSYH
ncbi:hypothetical protein EV182_004012 [Spiromyces aspiralis]|uniref:Uncharacterized protein n=1 Tax=Spiromyces aspiralis TaxID=68401 RepID=A0ACC1HPT3_9FUNG|nr:hypothetical protein EV182_004012 [Spiromyces aspiralis]